MKLIRFYCTIALLLWPVALRPVAQDAKKTSSQPDHSAEAYVVEQRTQRTRFENDGTSVRDFSERVRIQSDAAREQLGVVIFGYEKSTETVAIDYVRVHKPDGTTITTPTDDAQDMPADITREAPFYSDLQEKHLAVKGLGTGDVLEYRCHWNKTKPLVAGQFWLESGFPRDEVALEQKIEVSVPANRDVKFKSPGLTPGISQEGDRRIYSWTRLNMEPQHGSKMELADLQIRGAFPPADIELTSFQSWEELGRWYSALQQERVAPTDEIRAKAAELTRNAADDATKIQAIYNYVREDFRYIGVGFGIGRYQPHSAGEVLSNRYGDCKDKHTLLASLLGAAGIRAYPALVSSSNLLDPDVPSPAQFDHLITVVPRGNELLWLDSTTEVAPMGYLVSSLRDKQALVVYSDKPSSLLSTPVNPPFPLFWTFKIDAKMDDSGTLTGKVEQTIRGDLEVIWRSELRTVAKAQWKEFIQKLSYSLNFSGEVSDVNISNPESVDAPLHFTYTYTRKQYPDWESHQIRPPSPDVFLLPLEENGQLPQRLWLGAPGEFNFESRVEVPKSFAPSLPPNRDFHQDFGEYHSAYSFENGVLLVRYHVVVKAPELTGGKVTEYKAMAEKVQADHNQFVLFSDHPVFVQSRELPQQAMLSIMERLAVLPSSSDPAAREFEQECHRAFMRNDIRGMLEALKKAAAQDPKCTRYWLLLGQLQMATREGNSALDAFRKGVDSDPQQPLSYKLLALALATMNRPDEAIKVWQDLAKVAPQDTEVPVNLASLLTQEKRFAEALPYWEAAVKLHPEASRLQMGLGTAQLGAGEKDQARAAFEKVVQLDPGAGAKNDVAYVLASANDQLDDALRYAQSAVHDEEEASRKVQLGALETSDLVHTMNLGAYWDTLGWVYYRRDNLKMAESYLQAAWLLRQDPIIGYHLAQVYEKQKRQPEAVRIYRFVTSIGSYGRGTEDQEAIDEAAKRLRGQPKPPPHQAGRLMLPDNPAEELSMQRSVTLPKLVSRQANAEFFLFFAPALKLEGTTKTGVGTARDAIVEDTVFISGSDLLRSAGTALRQANFKVAFPEGSSGRLLRRGILACYPITGCTFVLIPPDTVRQVN